MGQTSRAAGSGSAALGDKRGGVGPSHGEDGIRKATVVGKGRSAQKAIQKVGDRHLPKEEVGTDEPGQDVEGEREAPSAELERLRLMIPKSRSTTRKKGSPQAR